MSKSLSSSPPFYRKGLSGGKAPDRKRLALIGIGIALGIVVLLVLAVFAYGALGNAGPRATPTPVPTATPGPTSSTPGFEAVVALIALLGGALYLRRA